MKKWLSIGIFLFSCCFTTFAQKELFLKKEFIYKSDTLRYRILLPINSDKQKMSPKPLVVFLHGSGERGNDNEKQLVHGADLFTDSVNRTNYPAYVIFPQCPEKDSWVALNEKPDDTFDLIDTPKPTKSLMLVKKLIESYQKSGYVDSKRIYVAGLSLGGMGTFDLICRYPNTFAAAISICGGVNVKRLKAVAHMPVRIYNGGSDNLVLPEYSRGAYNELKANGSKKAEHIEFPGVGHDSWTPAFAEPDFLKWLFSQKKQ